MRNKISINFLLVLFAALITSCISSRQPLNPIVSQSEERIIGFGSGGGIAGHYNQAYLYNNGKLIYKEGFPNQEPVVNEEYQLTQGQTDSLFLAIDKTGIKTIDFNYPSNLSYFLSLKESDKTYNIIWGGDKQAPENIEKFYNRSLDILTKYRTK